MQLCDILCLSSHLLLFYLSATVYLIKTKRLVYNVLTHIHNDHYRAPVYAAICSFSLQLFHNENLSALLLITAAL